MFYFDISNENVLFQKNKVKGEWSMWNSGRVNFLEIKFIQRLNGD